MARSESRATPALRRVRSVSRSTDLLAAFDEHHASLSLLELIERTALPKTTVVRLIQTLTSSGFLFRRADGRYCLGPVLIRLSRAVATAWELPPAAEEAMTKLWSETEETVNLYVLNGLTRICVAQKPGSQSIRYVVPVGHSLPLWMGASGKVLLAYQTDAFVVELLRAAGESARLDGLRVEFERIRAAGCGWSVGEREPQAASVSAPIRHRHRGVVAALAVSGPTPRFTEAAIARFAALLDPAAREVGIALEGESVGFAAAPLHGDAALRF